MCLCRSASHADHSKERPPDCLSIAEKYHHCNVLLVDLRLWHQCYTGSLKLPSHQVAHNQLPLKTVGALGYSQEDGERADGPRLEAANSQPHNEQLSCQAMSQFFSHWTTILIYSVLMSYTTGLPSIYSMSPGHATSTCKNKAFMRQSFC